MSTTVGMVAEHQGTPRLPGQVASSREPAGIDKVGQQLRTSGLDALAPQPLQAQTAYPEVSTDPRIDHCAVEDTRMIVAEEYARNSRKVPQGAARRDRVMSMYDIGAGADASQPSHDRDSGFLDVARGGTGDSRVDNGLVARPQQLEREITHIHRGAGPDIELDVCNQDPHCLSVHLRLLPGWRSRSRV